MEFNKELLDKFMTKNYVVHTETIEEYNEFMALLEAQTSLTWLSGERPTESDNWRFFKDKTCVFPPKVNGLISYGNVYSVELSDKYEIIEFSDLLKPKEENDNTKVKELLQKSYRIDEKLDLIKGKTTFFAGHNLHDIFFRGEEFFDEKMLSALKICLEEEKEECEKEMIELLKKEK